MSYLRTLFSFENEHIVITGGAGTIARSLAAGFLQAGGQVSLWGRNSTTLDEALQQISTRIPQADRHAHMVVVDCTDKVALQKAFDHSLHTVSMPTVLLNCVGGNRSKTSFLEQDETDFKHILELNLLAGVVLPTQVFVKVWKAQQIAGSIINFSSMASYRCLSGAWAYSAAKAGVLHLTKGMAREFSAWNIRVNAISPGFFLGKQNKDLLVEKDLPLTLTERGKEVIARTPMGRFGNHKDLQAAALFLASNRAAEFVTGIDLPVDGGFLTDTL